MAETESKQTTKLCCQCGFANLSVAKFCIECGERFAPSIAADTARDSNAISPTAILNSVAAQVDPLAALDRFLGSQKTEDAAARLKSAVESNRAQLKSLGVSIPRATNPIVVSLMESLKALPSDEVSARVAIVKALGKMGDPAVLPPMLLVTGASAKEVRMTVAAALGNIRHPLSAYLLLPMLQDGSSRVRQAAIRSLLQIVQPQTVESMLAACLCSNSLRALVMESLHLVTTEHRVAFFGLMAASGVGNESGTRIVAEWLRHEFRNKLTINPELAGNSRPEIQQPATDHASPAKKSKSPSVASRVETASVQDALKDTSGSCDVIETVQPESPSQPKPRPAERQNPTRETRKKSSDSNFFSWNDESSVYGESSDTAAIGHGGHSSTAALDFEQTEVNALYEDNYEIDDQLAIDSDSSTADMAFFEAMTDSFLDETTGAEADDQFELASNGSQANLSLSGLPGSPKIPNRRSAPAPATSLRPTPRHTTTFPNASATNLTASSAMIGAFAGTPAFDLTASSPLIQAFTSHRSPQGLATDQINTTVQPAAPFGVASSQSAPVETTTTVTRAVDEESDADKEAEEEARKEAARARALTRLGAAREAAFRELVKDAEQIPTRPPRLLAKKIAALNATPSTKLEDTQEKLKDLGATASPAALATLGAFSQKPAKAIREAAAEAMGNIKHPGSAVLLLKLLEDKSGTVTEAAVKSLVSLDLKPTRPVLLAAGLCATSLRSVVTSGVEAADVEKKLEWEQLLLDVAEGDDSDAAAFAVSLLARIAGESRLEIFQIMARDPAPVLRAAAIEALARTLAKRAISQINEALEDTDPIVRAQAAMSVATMYSPRSVELLQKLIFDQNLTVRRNAAQSMSRIDEADLAGTIAKALDQETDATTVEYLLAALARNGADGSLPMLQRYVEDQSSAFREQAVKALRKLRIPASVPIFRRLLDDNAATLRRQSVEQLVVLKSEDDLPRLREMLKKDPDEVVRGACAKALGDFGDDTSLSLLEDALEDHPAVRIQAVIALGRLGQASAGPVLLGLLRDQQPEIRYQSVKALGQLKLKGSAEAIQELIQDSDEMVRRGAEQSLQDLGMTVAQIRKKKLFRKVSSVASRLAPSAIAGVVPGGSKVLLSLVLLITVLGGYWTLSGLKLFAQGGEQLPAGRVMAVGVSGATNTAVVLRIRGVLDIWSVVEGKLVDRIKAPRSAIQLICEESGGILLDSKTELTRLDPKSAFSEEGAQRIKFDVAPSAMYFHQKSNRICAFFASSGETKLSVIDAATLKETKSFTIKAECRRSCVVSPDYSLALMIDPSGTITLCDLKSGEVVHASVMQMTGSDTLGTIYGIGFTDDMKYVCVCTARNFLALTVNGMEVIRNFPSPDGNSFIASQSVPGTSDLVVMSSVGKIYRFSRNFKEMAESKLERSGLFDVSAMGAGGDLIIVANTEETGFDVFSSAAQKVLIASSADQ